MTPKIEVTKTQEGFKVYGRMGAVLRANNKKSVIYSNLHVGAEEFHRMVAALKEFKA